MISIEVVVSTLEGWSRFLFNKFDTIQACQAYMLTDYWHLYQSWINFMFMRHHVDFNCVYTGI